MDAAINIQKAIAESGLLPAGIGGDYGEVIMGDLGQEARLDYTVIGGIVNFAARMCNHAREGEIAVTDRLFERLDEGAKAAIDDSYSSKPIRVKLKPTDPEVGGVLLTNST